MQWSRLSYGRHCTRIRSHTLRYQVNSYRVSPVDLVREFDCCASQADDIFEPNRCTTCWLLISAGSSATSVVVEVMIVGRCTRARARSGRRETGKEEERRLAAAQTTARATAVRRAHERHTLLGQSDAWHAPQPRHSGPLLFRCKFARAKGNQLHRARGSSRSGAEANGQTLKSSTKSAAGPKVSCCSCCRPVRARTVAH